jgi:hypothetical protein
MKKTLKPPHKTPTVETGKDRLQAHESAWHEQPYQCQDQT